ncbi:NAD-binding protein [Bilophila sp.]|uniref:potassium channel family protein n=1 Tax=Bilophila sp. TaxID=1929485 RepID=UPI003076D8C0
MKLLLTLLPALLTQTTGRRNQRIVIGFLLFTTVLVALFSIVFHQIMAYEGRDYSYITGVYWTLTVMSTLGFGDITFTSDIGKLFSIIVLVSGIILIMIVMPFTFIRFVYQPWIEEYNNKRKPRSLPSDTSGHTVLVGDNDISLSVARKLRQHNYPYVILVPDGQHALELYDNRYDVVTGEFDDANTYRNLRADKAALVAALEGDLRNTNIASTVREVAPSTLLAASAENPEAMNILMLAGCDHVYSFTEMLGRSLARRVYGTRAQSNIIARFGTLCLAEAPVIHTEFMGQTLRECRFRERFGLNVAGLWEGNSYMSARPDSRIDEASILLLAGTADQLEAYDRKAERWSKANRTPVLILGGGKVGEAAADALERRGLPFCLVEKNPRLVPPDDPRYILGNAGELAVLQRAHIMETPSVIVTTHDDDLNIYLTIYCRKLRPDVQILSRSTLDRNVASLYNAGANLVMSHASMAASTIINLLSPGRVTILTEGLNIFRVTAPPALVGLCLRDSRIREKTDCNVVALKSQGVLRVPPDPNAPMKPDTVLVLIGTADAERRFMEHFPS